MRILIANLFGIGDVLFSLPLVRALKASAPDPFIGYLCNARTEELVAAWPEVDWSMAFEKDDFRRTWKQSKKEGWRFLSQTLDTVRAQKFDLLVDLSLGWHNGFAGLLCGIPRRIGFNFRDRGRFLTQSIRLDGFTQSVAEHYLDLLRPIEFPRPARTSYEMAVPPGALRETDDYLTKLGLLEKPFAVVAPGGGASWGPHAKLKQWTPEGFAAAADHLRSRHQVEILLAGDEREQGLCEETARRMNTRPKGTLNLPSLLTLAGVLQRARLVVGNDGGTLHLAAAAGAPTVSIFGPVDAAVYGPVPGGPRNRVVTQTLACRPCYQRFRLPPCPWDNACLKQLEAEPVLQAIDAVL